MLKIFNFGKPKYQAPQVAPVPEGRSSQGNAVYFNDDTRSFRIDLFDRGDVVDMERALGTLELAKDVVKAKISEWQMKEKRRASLLVPANGKPGGLHVC